VKEGKGLGTWDAALWRVCCDERIYYITKSTISDILLAF